jgi:hypothetical protein
MHLRGSELASEQRTADILRGLVDSGVEFIVVGGTAAVMLGAPVVTEDVDIVHRRTPENVTRLIAWLHDHGAYHRLDLMNRKLAPKADMLSGVGHLNLQTRLGKLDVLCELGEGEGYEEILSDTITLTDGETTVRVLDLPRLIAVKARANRAKDRLVLPLLLATLDERRKR